MPTINVDIPDFTAEDIHVLFEQSSPNRPIVVWDKNIPGFHIIFSKNGNQTINPDTGEKEIANFIEIAFEFWNPDRVLQSLIVLDSMSQLTDDVLKDARQDAADEFEYIRHMLHRETDFKTFIIDNLTPTVKARIEKYQTKLLSLAKE